MTQPLPAPAGAPRLTPDDMMEAFARMGGVLGLVKFARKTPANERFFWTVLFPKLLPLMMQDDGETGRQLAVVAATWLPSAEGDQPHD